MRINELEVIVDACNRLADMINYDFSCDIRNLVDRVEDYIDARGDEIIEQKYTIKGLERRVEQLEDLLEDKTEQIKDLEAEIERLEEKNSD